MIGTALECIAWLSTQKDGTFEVDFHKEKRSLSANALYFKMVREMAKYLHISNPRMHNQLLRKYGVHQLMDGEEVWVALPDTVETEDQVEEDEYNHFQPTLKKTGSKRWYILLKPSHEFDTAEMSRLIDGAADEMRNMGLFPPMDEDIKRAIENYEKRHKKETE
jgi:hypothetical protein